MLVHWHCWSYHAGGFHWISLSLLKCWSYHVDFNWISWGLNLYHPRISRVTDLSILQSGSNLTSSLQVRSTEKQQHSQVFLCEQHLQHRNSNSCYLNNISKCLFRWLHLQTYDFKIILSTTSTKRSNTLYRLSASQIMNKTHICRSLLAGQRQEEIFRRVKVKIWGKYKKIWGHYHEERWGKYEEKWGSENESWYFESVCDLASMCGNARTWK